MPQVKIEEPIKSFAEAQRFVRNVFKNEATCRTKDGWLCQVVGKDGTILGAASNWMDACRAACKPLLEAKQRAAIEAAEIAQRDAADFLQFLRHHLADAFELWKKERAEKDKGQPCGDVCTHDPRCPKENTDDAPSGLPPSDR